MKISVLLSLEHLCSTKIVLSLLREEMPLVETSCLRTSRFLKSETLVYAWDPQKVYNDIYKHISEKIKSLKLISPLQKKLRRFIPALYCEIQNWITMLQESSSCYDDALVIMLGSIPDCWSPNGLIDRQKSANFLVKNNNASITHQFILACLFCLIDDVLNIWKTLCGYTRFYLRQNADVALWLEGLENMSIRDYQSFINWVLDTKLWIKNVYALKHVLKELNPTEKSLFLSKALMQEVNSDVMLLGLSLMTRNEQEIIFKASPVAVFKCLTLWPMQNTLFYMMDILMPNLTCVTFCNILNFLLLQIKSQKKDYEEILAILKNFWGLSPSIFKEFAHNDSKIYDPLQIVLKHNFTEAFPMQRFLDCFHDDSFLMNFNDPHLLDNDPYFMNFNDPQFMNCPPLINVHELFRNMHL